MRTLKYILFILTGLLSLTCNKIELPLNPVEAPIFELKATFGNQPVNFAAGVDGLELDTRFATENLDVLILQGELKKKNCVPPCPSSLRVSLRQNHREFLANTGIGLSPGRRPFYRDARDSFLVHSKSLSQLSNTGSGRYEFKWTLNDKKVADKEIVSFPFNPQMKNTVCLYVSHPDGSNANQCQVIDYSVKDSFPGLKVSIEPQYNQNRGWTLVPKVRGIGPFKYKWNNKSTDPVLELDAKQVSSHCITVLDAIGNAASACVDFNPEGKVKCRADFELAADVSRLKEWTQFNTADIVFVNDRGDRFLSSVMAQPSNAVFEILEVTPFEENAQQQPTRKLKIRFDLLLYGANKTATPFKGTGTIAVAHPK